MSPYSIQVARADPRRTSTSGLVCTALALLLLYFRPLLELFVSGQIAVTSQATQTLYITTVSLAALAFVLESKVGRLRRVGYPVLFLMVAVGVTCLCGFASAVPLAATIASLHSLIGTWLTFVIFRFACETRRGAVAITVLLVVCAMINSVVGLWGVATKRTLFDVGADVVGTGSFGYDRATGRSGGIAGENYVGMYDVPALVAGLCLIPVRRWRLAGMSLAALSSAAIVVSLSRTSMCSGLTAALLFIAISMKRTRSALRLAVIILVAVYVGASYITEQIDMVPGMSAANSTGYRFTAEGLTNESRLEIWHGYFDEVMADNAILGMGGGYLTDQLSMSRRLPHNSLLDMLVEYGCLGLLLYICAFALVIRHWARCRGSSHHILPDLLFCCFCGMTVSIMTLSNPLARPLWAVAGAVVGVRRWAEVEPLSVLPWRGNASSLLAGYSAEALSRAQSQFSGKRQEAG
jgi:O-antigen ligase